MSARLDAIEREGVRTVARVLRTVADHLTRIAAGDGGAGASLQAAIDVLEGQATVLRDYASTFARQELDAHGVHPLLLRTLDRGTIVRAAMQIIYSDGYIIEPGTAGTVEKPIQVGLSAVRWGGVPLAAPPLPTSHDALEIITTPEPANDDAAGDESARP